MRVGVCSSISTGVALAALAFAACGTSETNGVEPVDYSVTAHWLSLPISPTPAFPVDVFYILPTAWTSSDNTYPQICAIDEPTLMQGAPPWFAIQATAFGTFANIYAPYYRQDNLSSVDRLNIIAGTPTTDVTAAFDYYIRNYNGGRPFFLLGHSQGSTVMSNLLSSYMRAHPEVLKNMIAAYAIGTPITAQYLADNPHLKFAEGPDDTGVIVSYNTEAPDQDPARNPVLYGLVGLVINPLSWTRDEAEAGTDQGLGSFMPDGPDGEYIPVPQYADARIDTKNGVLICRTCNEAALGSGIYHRYDIPFYYFNLRQNAANRAEKFSGASR